MAPALIYNGINSTIDVYRGHVHDMYGSMAAAALTGLIWRSTGTFLPFSFSSGAPVRSARSSEHVCFAQVLTQIPSLSSLSLAFRAIDSWHQVDGRHV